LFVVVFQLYCAIYGMAFFVSFLVTPKNAALLAVVLSLMFSSMTGKSDIPERIQFLSPSRWAVEALFDYETRPYRHIMDVTSSANSGGYTLGRVPLDLALMFITGIFYRVLAYIAMRFADRKIVIS
jgi:ABC-type multidrug transport system permease subunit